MGGGGGGKKRQQQQKEEGRMGKKNTHNLNDEPTGSASNIISCIPQKSARKEVMKSVEKDFLKLKLLPPPPTPPWVFFLLITHFILTWTKFWGAAVKLCL